MNKKFDIKIRLLSPLMHYGDEMSGTMQTARKMPFRVGNEYIDIPVFSGNALRGIIRRLLMQDLLEKIGYSVSSVSQNVYYTLFSGGALKSGGGIDLEFKKMLKENCPALVLLGSAFGNQMTEGKMKVDISKPVCSEMNDYNVNKSDISIFDGMLSDVFHTRLDSLKSNVEVCGDCEEKQVVQMKYEAETLSAGTVLETGIYLECASELEVSCAEYALNLLKNHGYIGGKSASGYGKISLEFNNSDDNGELYKNFVDEHKEEIRNFIAYLEQYLV